MVHFADRTDAGRRLGAAIAARAEATDELDDAVVLGLPRGGVPVAAEVARALGAPLDVVVVRKLGAPHHREYAMGAIGEGGVRVLDDQVVAALRLSDHEVAAVESEERAELARHVERYRGARDAVTLDGRCALVVDDGLATGATALAACSVVRALGARRVVVAVPVASPQAVDAVRAAADQVVSLHTPPDFRAVGAWYDDFSPTSNDTVVALLSADAAG